MAFPVVRVCIAVGGLVRGQLLLLLFDACAVTCGRSFTMLSVWGDLIMELLALCDGCLGWGWVWLAGLVAGCG